MNNQATHKDLISDDSRVKIASSLKELEQGHNKLILDINSFLEFQEESRHELFNSEAEENLLVLLTDLIEHTKAIHKLFQVFSNKTDAIFESDLDVCDEFFEDTKTLVSEIKKTLSKYKK